MRLLILQFFLIFLILHSTAYADTTFHRVESRTLEIWGSPIHYQVVIQEDSNLQFDGEAYTRGNGGRRINYVVLNKVFFGKEARGIFQQFAQEDFNQVSFHLPSHHELMMLENKLAQLRPSPFKHKPLSASLRSSLKTIQSVLERRAWLDLYKTCLREASSQEKAEQIFIDRFSQIRMKTIEYHEVSHLKDLAFAKRHDSQAFERFTELRAFYTELAYGENPHDVMVQAISGLVDEMNQGRWVDYSIEKVARVVALLNETPSFSNLLTSEKLPKCCLEILAELAPRDFVLAGRQLYYSNIKYLSSLS